MASEYGGNASCSRIRLPQSRSRSAALSILERTLIPQWTRNQRLAMASDLSTRTPPRPTGSVSGSDTPRLQQFLKEIRRLCVAERRTNKLGTILELKLRRCERHGGSYRDDLNPHACGSTTRLYCLADTAPTAAKNYVTINDTGSTQLDTTLPLHHDRTTRQTQAMIMNTSLITTTLALIWHRSLQ